MIGGEFEIDLSLQRDGFVERPNTYYYASGRAALYQILRSLTPAYNEIWLPDWLCHSMVEAVEKAGFKYRFYALGDDFKPSIEALKHSGFENGKVVLMVNYFGLQDHTQTAKNIKFSFPNAIVIEDDVQAYWAFAEKDNPFADYRFTSLRKSLAIPDGGLVKTNKSMPKAFGQNSFSQYKIKAGQMKLNRDKEGIRDEDYLALFEEGERLIDKNYDNQMSEDSKKLFAGIDFDQVKKQRQSNSNFIISELDKLGVKSLINVSVDSVPLFIPIALSNRNLVRKALFQKEIFCPIHWPLEGMNVKKGKEMSESELSLIIDQRYDIEDMKTIISVIKSNI